MQCVFVYLQVDAGLKTRLKTCVTELLEIPFYIRLLEVRLQCLFDQL